MSMRKLNQPSTCKQTNEQTSKQSYNNKNNDSNKNRRMIAINRHINTKENEIIS